MRWMSALTLSAALLACSPELPPAPDVSTPYPVPAVAPPAPDEPGWTRLANGLRVAIRAIPDAQDVAVLTVFSIGSDHDPAGQSGLAHLVEHLYVTAAAGSIRPRTCEEMSGRNPSWGAQTNARTTSIRTVIAPHSLAMELTDAAARMSDLRIEPSDLDRERPRVFEQISGFEMAATGAAAAQFAVERMYALPRGAGMGLRAEVERLSLEGFRARCHRFYRPVNARLVITGAIDAAATLALVERTFGHLPAGEQVQPVAAREPVWSGRFDVDLAPPGTADADCEREVCISCPAPPSRSEPAFVTLGYLVQPATNAQQGFQFDTDTEHRTVAFHWTGDDRPVDEIVRRFDEVIARFAVRSPTAADLAPVRDAYDAFFTGYSKSSELRGECAHPPAQFARYVAEAAKDGLDRDRFCTALAAVTQADLRRVAATWLAPERRVVAVLRRARTPTMNMKAGWIMSQRANPTR